MSEISKTQMDEALKLGKLASHIAHQGKYTAIAILAIQGKKMSVCFGGDDQPGASEMIRILKEAGAYMIHSAEKIENGTCIPEPLDGHCQQFKEKEDKPEDDKPFFPN